jgi:hypothetical protein
MVGLVATWAAVGLVPGAAQYVTWDDTDPTLTGCSAPQQLRPPMDRSPANLPDGGILALRYSYGCRTVWAELSGGVPGSTTAVVQRSSDGRRQLCTADARGDCTTRQLDDADVTSCAEAHGGPAVTRTGCI